MDWVQIDNTIHNKRKRGMGFMMIKMIYWNRVGSNQSSYISHVGREEIKIKTKINGKKRRKRKKMMMDAVENI
jgi:hypothetical protein